MLKWAVIKRSSEDKSAVSKCHLIEEVFYDDAIQITANKFRRHSNTFPIQDIQYSHNAERKSTSTFYSKQNKEKCFTSTPVKIFQNHRIDFRDVKNQPLKNLNRKIITKRSMQQNACLRPRNTSLFDINSEKRSFKFHNKCTLKINNFLNYKNSFRKSNTKPLELEKCYIKNILEQNCTCKCNYNYSSLRSNGYDYYSPTLPTLEIEDFHISVPPDLNLNVLIPEFSSTVNSLSMYKSNHEYDEPLLKKFRYDPINNSKICNAPIFNIEEKIAFVIDQVNRIKQLINFNKLIVDDNRNYNICKDVYRSYSINDLIFNIAVYTMIQKSSNINDRTKINKLWEKYSSLLINVQISLQKFSNELNKTRANKLKNTLHKKPFNAAIDSFNSKLIRAKSNYLYKKDELLQSNIIDTDSTFLYKKIKIKPEKEICRVTAATVDFSNTCAYDGKYVDRSRKRSYSTFVSNGINTKVDQAIECYSEPKCSLKRQNCVKRIKR